MYKNHVFIAKMLKDLRKIDFLLALQGEQYQEELLMVMSIQKFFKLKYFLKQLAIITQT